MLPSPENSEPAKQKLKNEAGLILSVIAVGISSTITQIILLREFLSVFYGNELVIGIILANWMMLTGFGSFLGKYSTKVKNKINLLIILLLLISVIPIITVFSVDILRNIVFPVGTMVGIIQILYSSFILLIPFCVTSGFTFTTFVNVISERYRTNLIPSVYSWESFGSVIGGFAFSMIMIYFITTFKSVIMAMTFNLSATFVFSFIYGGKIAKYIVLIIFVIIPTGLMTVDLDKISKEYLFQNQNLIDYKDTPYGKITVTEQGEQKNFYENDNLLFSTNDPTLNEEAIHYAMLQHKNPKRVLLISGGISGTMSELLKYKVDKIFYVETNPWLIEIGKKYSTELTDDKIKIINQDARLYIKTTSEYFDVVLINLPEPSTVQINRFYTTEFFNELKRRLRDGAVISIGLTSSADYLSPEARQLKSSIYNTLTRSFKNILIVPGYKDYFIASDSILSINIPQLTEQKGVVNRYVNHYYLDENVLKQRSLFILNNIDKTTSLNEDFSPISYYQQLQYWLSYFEINYWLIGVIAALIFIFLIFQLNTISFGIFTGGFSASSVEIILLITFQILYGYVYQITGIIITLFMAGLAVGSRYYLKIFPDLNILSFIKIQFIIGIFAIFLPSYSHLDYLIHTFFFLLTLIVAILIGMEFSVASKLRKRAYSSIASNLYSVDMIGSAIGALLVTTYLMPLLGIIKVCFLIAALNFISGSISFIRRKKYLLSTI
jgi:spermidine synthase